VNVCPPLGNTTGAVKYTLAALVNDLNQWPLLYQVLPSCLGMNHPAGIVILLVVAAAKGLAFGRAHTTPTRVPIRSAPHSTAIQDFLTFFTFLSFHLILFPSSFVQTVLSLLSITGFLPRKLVFVESSQASALRGT
jgi:hypothetical protein